MIDIKTYSTSQIAKIVGVHPNTVRMYEQWGLLQVPERKANGYRVYSDIHIAQFKLAKKAFQIEVLQAGLRKKVIEIVKFSAKYQFEDAINGAKEYLEIAKREMCYAKEVAEYANTLFEISPQNQKTYRRAEVAKELGLTIDTIRNWEMNGLLSIKRKENGYRVYDAIDMKRLKIIRSLRCANYSLSAILRMLNLLEQRQDGNALELLNTPHDDEDIVLACDRLIDSLEMASKNIEEVLEMLYEMKMNY